jgi:hypothetical protein
MSPIAPSTAIAVTDARQRHQPQRVGVADRVSAEDLVELIDLAAGEVDLAQAGLHRQLLIERQRVQPLGEPATPHAHRTGR